MSAVIARTRSGFSYCRRSACSPRGAGTFQSGWRCGCDASRNRLRHSARHTTEAEPQRIGKSDRRRDNLCAVGVRKRVAS
jgi:hypothetical protein